PKVEMALQQVGKLPKNGVEVQNRRDSAADIVNHNELSSSSLLAFKQPSLVQRCRNGLGQVEQQPELLIGNARPAVTVVGKQYPSRDPILSERHDGQRLGL